MNIKIDNTFDSIFGEKESIVFEIFPDVYYDNRGSFSEVLKFGNNALSEDCSWIFKNEWIKQINRSKSSESVIRGMHAQRGEYCQGKLVEAINNTIFDIIIDARPNSGTFGISKIYRLDSKEQNKLWVPRGFLHGFIVPDQLNGCDAIFNYYVDNVYNKESEICINPLSVVPNLIESTKDISKKDKTIQKYYEELIKTCMIKETLVYSEKDKCGEDYYNFMIKIREEYNKTGKVWYKK